jgi:hypothetical protein
MVFLWVDAWSQQFQAESVMRQNELVIGPMAGMGIHKYNISGIKMECLTTMKWKNLLLIMDNQVNLFSNQ